MQQAAAQAQGNQAPRPAGGMAPQSASVAGNTAKPGAPSRSNSPGVG
jgi:hypothetical protein